MKSKNRRAQSTPKEYRAKNEGKTGQESEQKTRANYEIKNVYGKLETGNGKLSKDDNLGPPGIGPGISTV